MLPIRTSPSAFFAAWMATLRALRFPPQFPRPQVWLDGQINKFGERSFRGISLRLQEPADALGATGLCPMTNMFSQNLGTCTSRSSLNPPGWTTIWSNICAQIFIGWRQHSLVLYRGNSSTTQLSAPLSLWWFVDEDLLELLIEAHSRLLTGSVTQTSSCPPEIPATIHSGWESRRSVNSCCHT